MAKRKNVKDIILELAAAEGEVASRAVAAAASITRQAAHYHLRQLVESGALVPVGEGRARRYLLAGRFHRRYETRSLQEHIVWSEVTASVDLGLLSGQARDVARYAFTEMLNNAIDHSGSEAVSVTVDIGGRGLVFSIVDRGVGAFLHVQQRLGLESLSHALLEISKGKMTTMPDRHSGEGIFFTSKVVQRFDLEANGLRMAVDNEVDDTATGDSDIDVGTRVRCVVVADPARSLSEVFAEYAPEGEFDRTRVKVRLAETGDSFVSRSEAKRLGAGLERFSEVIVDFAGVRLVGQGFADELFRVWANDHPEVTLVPEGMSQGVAATVQRALE